MSALFQDDAKGAYESLSEEDLYKIENSKELIVDLYDIQVSDGNWSKKGQEIHYDHIYEHPTNPNFVKATTYVYKKKSNGIYELAEIPDERLDRDILKTSLPIDYLKSRAYVEEFEYRETRYNAINADNFYQSGTAILKALVDNPVDFNLWAMVRAIEQEKFNRIAGNVVTLGSGVIAILAAIPTAGQSVTAYGQVVIMFSYVSSSIAVYKIYLNINEKFEEADEIPSGLLGLIGQGVGYAYGNEELRKSIGEFAESLIIFPEGIKDLPKNIINGNAIVIIDKMISLYNIKENYKEFIEILEDMKKEIENEMGK